MALDINMGLIATVLVVGAITWLLSKIIPFTMELVALYRTAAKFPSLPKHWLLGTIPLINKLGRENFNHYMIEAAKKYGKVFVTWRTALIPSLMVTHSKTIGEILRTSEPKNRRFRTGYTQSIPWLGEGLLISHGQKWERNRKLLTPAFHFTVLQPYVGIYNQAVDILLSKLDKAAQIGGSYEVFNPMALCTLDVMLRCAFSYKGKIQEEGELHPYVRAVKRLAYLVAERAMKPVMYINWIYNLSKDGREFNKLCDYVHEFAHEIIDKRRAALKENPEITNKRRLDFLDILLTARDEHGGELASEDIRAEVDTFLFEGHDTTASAASWAMYALAKYPNVQEKVYQEVHGLIGEKATVEWEDIPKLTYTSLFIKEVMRMYSPVPAISRQLSKPLVIDGVKVPAGMVIGVAIHIMHHNPSVWENPEDFRPERFAEEKYKSRDPYSYVPFSAGPRNCIGQMFALNEEKVIVARVVNRFRLELDLDHKIVMVPEMIMRARHGIKINFSRRT